MKQFPATAILLLTLSCAPEPERQRSFAVAFVGPAILELRADVSASTQSLATLKHGEKVEVLATRRRFVKVRNMGGTEGWVDGRRLLSTAQMQEVVRAAKEASALPAQGKASVGEALNMHLEPNRDAPSPFQIPANGSVDVVAHRVMPRTPYAVVSFAPPPAKKAPSKKSKKAAKKDESKYSRENPPPPPPMPPGPKTPGNWLALSRRAASESAPLKYDDWTLVRTPEGKAGWVLTRMLIMSIPDEVAQYADGKRIMAYFAVGSVKDRDKTKNHWLWATMAHPLSPYDFDWIRMFVYNPRRHRYETSYIERELRGYYPILMQEVVNSEGMKTPGFTFETEDKEGRRWKKVYAFAGQRPKLVNRFRVDQQQASATRTIEPSKPPAAVNAQPGLADRVKRWFHF